MFRPERSLAHLKALAKRAREKLESMEMEAVALREIIGGSGREAEGNAALIEEPTSGSDGTQAEVACK